MSDDDAAAGPPRSASESRFLREYLEAQERAAQAAREREAAEEQRRAQIDQANREVEMQRLAGTLEPAPLEKADEGIKQQYERRREEVRKAIEDGYRKEIELTLGDIKADASTKAYIDQIKLEIAEKWAREEAKRLEELERQEMERRAKERQMYDLDR
ncbi:hypothetical protein B9T07_26850 [Limnospira fusiformis CCALA 023]